MKNFESVSNYSKALIDSCIDDDQLKKSIEELQIFHHIYDKNQIIKNYLLDLFLSLGKRKSLLLSICSLLRISKLTINFILNCFINSRLDKLDMILDSLKTYLNKKNNVVSAKLYSNKFLEKNEINIIEADLSKKLSQNIFIDQNIIDNALISGIQIYFNNQIIDFSIFGMLNHYKKMLIKE